MQFLQWFRIESVAFVIVAMMSIGLYCLNRTINISTLAQGALQISKIHIDEILHFYVYTKLEILENRYM